MEMCGVCVFLSVFRFAFTREWNAVAVVAVQQLPPPEWQRAFNTKPFFWIRRNAQVTGSQSAANFFYL